MNTFLINKSGKDFLYSCVVYKNNCYDKISEELKIEMLSNQVVKNLMQKGQLFFSHVELKKDKAIKKSDKDISSNLPEMQDMTKFPNIPRKLFR